MIRLALPSALLPSSPLAIATLIGFLTLTTGCASMFDDAGDVSAPRQPAPTAAPNASVEQPAAVATEAVAKTNEASTAPETFVKPPSANYNNPDAYVLGNGDTIGILVFDEQDLTMDAVIGENGEINYSYLGALKVAGKTPEQLEREITQSLQAGYLVNPSVNVSIKQYRPFFISGEVRSPGAYPYQPGLNLEKAISLAGGLTDRASERRMYVVRAEQQSDGQQRIKMENAVAPGDVIEINEGFF